LFITVVFAGFIYWIDYLADLDSPSPPSILSITPTVINYKDIWDANKTTSTDDELSIAESKADMSASNADTTDFEVLITCILKLLISSAYFD